MPRYLTLEDDGIWVPWKWTGGDSVVLSILDWVLGCEDLNIADWIYVTRFWAVLSISSLFLRDILR